MSTREYSHLTPTPAELESRQTPSTLPSPGVSPGVVRVPTAPTLPDADPATLTRLVQQVANEMFGFGVVLPSPSAAGSEPFQQGYVAPGGAPAVDGLTQSGSSGVPAAAGAIPSTGGVPTSMGAVPTSMGAVPPSMGAVPTSMGAVPPSTGAVPPSTGAVPPSGAVPSSTASTPPAIAPSLAPMPSTSPPVAPTLEPSTSPTSPTSTTSTTSPTSPTSPTSTTTTTTTAPTAPTALATPTTPTTLPPAASSSAVTPSADAIAPPRGSVPVDSGSSPFHTAPRFDSLDSAHFEPWTTSFVDVPHEIEQPRLDLPKSSGTFDPYAVRREFPILDERVNGRRLVWLDNAATTQKPRAVIDRLKYFYEHENSNIHRAAHTLAARATDAYEGARETIRRFLNASSKNEIVFVRGATEGINLVAKSWGKRYVEAGDEIVVTHLEHHANIVPWQMLCTEVGAKLRVAPVDDTGQIILEEYERLFTTKTKLAAIPQVSNALGTITPAKDMIEIAHRFGAKVLLDGAQSVSHMRVDLQQLDCDFFVFSGHKVFAPTGIGAVFGKAEILEHTPPWQGGGNMISDVTFEKTQYHAAPFRFEAGTGSIADAAGLGAALDWLSRTGIENVERHEHDLLVYATEQLRRVKGLKIIGTAPNKAGVISFVVDGHSTSDISSFLDTRGIAVRGGHHCAQPILRRFGLESTVRASLAPYNLCEDIDALVDALLEITR